MIFSQLIDVYIYKRPRRGLFISNVFSAVLARSVTLIANLGRFIYLYTKGSRRLMWIARLYRLHTGQKIHSKSVTRKATFLFLLLALLYIVGLFRPPFIDLPCRATTRRIGGTTDKSAPSILVPAASPAFNQNAFLGRNARVPFLFGCAEKSPRITLGNPQWNNNLKLAGVRALPALLFWPLFIGTQYIVSRAKELRHNYVVYSLRTAQTSLNDITRLQDTSFLNLRADY